MSSWRESCSPQANSFVCNTERKKKKKTVEVVPTYMRKLAKGTGLCMPSECGRQISTSRGGSSPAEHVQSPGKDEEGGKVSILVIQSVFK